MTCDTLEKWEGPTFGKYDEGTATAGLPLAGDQLLPTSHDRPACPDYSEEAIEARDPAYRLPDGTLSESQTVEHLPAAERLVLIRRLEQLGMSPDRAAWVVSLG